MHTPTCTSRAAAAAAVMVAVMLVTLAPRPAGAAAAGPPAPVIYRPPVSAPVSDPFRPPADPYGAGNRGIEYATTPGTSVWAAADGVVTFAGPVAGDVWVTVGHDDGIRTVYGPMATIVVSAGANVVAGEVLGTARDRLLFTARLGDTYLDPAVLLAAGPGSIHLIPEDEPGKAMATRFGVVRSEALDPAWLATAIEWARGAARLPFIVPTDPLDLLPVPAPTDLFRAGWRWLSQRGRCTSPDVHPVPPPGRRVAVFVAGLGSTGADAAIDGLDSAVLGYATGDGLRFSYAGGRVPGDVAHDLGHLEVNDYSTSDTLGDLVATGHRLADLLVAAAGTVPADVPLDVLAHSQGGIVTRLALDELAIRAPDVLDRIGLVVTLGTPHQGADLAGLIASLAANPLARLGLEAIQHLIGTGIEPAAVAVQQLAPGSEIIRRLEATPLPVGVDLVSIAARADPVVPSPRSHVAGATNVVIGVEGLNDHDALPASAGASREIALALAGLPPSCEGLLDILGDIAVGESIANLEDLYGFASRLGE